MDIERGKARAEKTEALGRDISRLCGCVDCPGCRGLCAELIEVVFLPDLLLHRVDAA